MKPKFVTVLFAGTLLASFAAVSQAGEGEGRISFAPAMTPGSEHAPDSITPTSAYYFVPASTFNRRSSMASTSDAGAGCIKMNGPTYNGGAIAADIQIPNGSSLLGVRYYYADTSATNSITLTLTSFDGASNYSDLVLGVSPAQVGYNSDYLTLASPVIVDNYLSSYVIQAYPSGSSPTFCGARVFYSVP